MSTTRRRELSILFALMMIIELATLCCACAKLESHCCPDCARCAICEYLRIPLENAIGVRVLLTAPVAAAIVLRRMQRRMRFSAARLTLIAQKVELDD